MDETIFMCGIYGYRARRVLFAVQLQDRGEHRARYVTAHETFENVVITLFDFEQGTDANYHDWRYIIHLQRLAFPELARQDSELHEVNTTRS